MISLQQVLYIHSKLIENFGGGESVRDHGGLEAAIARPYATFDGIDLYPDAIDKAAAISESLIINHPFIDGNKRTAYTLLRLMLLNFDLDITTSEDEKYKMTIAASTGNLKFDAVKLWLSTKTITTSK